MADGEETAAPKGFTVRVQTSGLVALVPDTSGNSLGLLMVDAPAAMEAENGCEMAKHYPTISWIAGSCRPEGGPCDGNSETLSSEDVQLRFLGDGPISAQPSLDLAELANPAARPSEEYPSASTAQAGPLGPEWTLHLSELYPQGSSDSVALRPGCLQTPPEDCPVVARMRLDYGTVRTCELAAIEVDEEPGEPEPSTADDAVEPGSPPPWIFALQTFNGDRPTNFKPRALAMVAEVAWQVDAESLDLVLRPFDGSKPSRTISLTPDANNEVILLYRNLPEEEWEAPGDCDAQKVDYHFEHYYRLAEAEPDSSYIPHAVQAVEADYRPRLCTTSVTGHTHGTSGDAESSTGLGPLPIPPGTAACVKLVYPSDAGVGQLHAITLGDD